MTTLVVTDLDGTLWDTTLQCHPNVLAAVDQLLNDDSIELLVATGRRRNSARRAFESNGLVLPSVLLNGAIGFDFEADHVFHQQTFTVQQIQVVLAILQQHELAPVAYLSDTRAVAVEGVTTSERHLASLGTDIVWMSVDELATHQDVLGMSMLGVERDEAERALKPLMELPGAEVAAYADHLYPPFSLMVAPANVTKELGINAYLAYRGLKPDRIVALGDGGNDLEMLAMADVAIAVNDADPRALALADHIIERPQNGGWASVLDLL